MNKNSVNELAGREADVDPLTELLKPDTPNPSENGRIVGGARGRPNWRG